MAIREILTAENPFLRRKAKRVRRFDGTIGALVEDMAATMEAAKGVGLAAPQVGVPIRCFVVRLAEDHEGPHAGELLVFFNPEIVEASGEEEGEEGCLSFPGYAGEVVRATAITLKGQDERGRHKRLKAEGYLARVLQHELDHLDGILFQDRLTSSDKRACGMPTAASRFSKRARFDFEPIRPT